MKSLFAAVFLMFAITGCYVTDTQSAPTAPIQIMDLSEEQFSKELKLALYERHASAVVMQTREPTSYNQLVVAQTAFSAWWQGTAAIRSDCRPVSEYDAVAAITARLMTQYDTRPFADAATIVFQETFCSPT